MAGIIIISDTHGYIPVNLSEFSEETLFHAGDIADLHTMNELFIFKNVYIARGNCDFFDASGLQDIVTAEIEGVKIMMVHNLAAPHRIIYSNQVAIEKFKPRVVISGHSHTPYLKEENGILFVNPGSLGKIGLTGVYSFAKMTVENGAVTYAALFDADSGKVLEEWKK